MIDTIIESYIFACGERRLSIYSERLLTQLAKVATSIAAKNNEKTPAELAETDIIIPIRTLLHKPSDKNHTQARYTIQELLKKPCIFDQSTEIILIDRLDNHTSGSINVKVTEDAWRILLDRTKGYVKYSYDMACSVSSPYTLRFLKLISNKQRTLEYSIQDLRNMFVLNDSYINTRDLIKYTIEKAKQELDLKSLWTFDINLQYDSSDEINLGRCGRKAITGILLNTYQHTPESIQKICDDYLIDEGINADIIRTLRNRFGFTMDEITANKIILKVAGKYINVLKYLDRIAFNAYRARNTQQFVINSIRDLLTNEYDLRF